MPAQVAQLVILDIHTIEQNLSGFMMIETRNQAGQGRLATAGTTDQGNHLPWLGAETDVVEYRLLAAGVLEAQVAHLEVATDPIKLDSAMVDFRGLVELLEDAFGTGQTFLDGRTDLR
ncbi:hypothetical protein FQZ97_992970 [compost metagenome]